MSLVCFPPSTPGSTSCWLHVTRRASGELLSRSGQLRDGGGILSRFERTAGRSGKLQCMYSAPRISTLTVLNQQRSLLYVKKIGKKLAVRSCKENMLTIILPICISSLKKSANISFVFSYLLFPSSHIHMYRNIYYFG